MTGLAERPGAPGPPPTPARAATVAAGAPVVVEALTYTYPAWSDEPVPALRDVSVSLDPGLTVIDGDSGSGKSTLLRVLNGLVPHFHGGVLRGRATVCGLDVSVTPTRRLARHVGFVFQEPEVGFVRGTVIREVAFFPENLGLPRATVSRRVVGALEQAGIVHLAPRRLRTLSGGERQRVALAAVLSACPPVLVLDEPMSQLDRRAAGALTATLEDLAGRGFTVVVAEHRLAGALGGARRLRLEDGRLSDSPAAPARPVPPAARLGAAASRAGAEVWSLSGVTVGVAGRPLLVGVDLGGVAGEVVIVTGPNASGKTTLLRTIAGLTPSLAGRVERRPGRVAYLPQEPGVLLHRDSVRAEIEQTLRWSKVDAPADEVLDLLGLRPLAQRDPRDLSGGQRQRAALAVVLAGRPTLALLDEPTRGMDAPARAALGAALRLLADHGAAVVVATHDVELARELGGRMLRIDDGSLATGTCP